MPTSTYVALATTTLSGGETELTFSSIPATYRDLIIVAGSVFSTNDVGMRIQFNSDTGANYSNVNAWASSPSSYDSNTVDTTRIFFAGYNVGMSTADRPSFALGSIMDYSATDKHKTVLSRWRTQSASADETGMVASRWANTDAINTIRLFTTSGSFSSGTISLYGIEA